jgi:hypothetical protein
MGIRSEHSLKTQLPGEFAKIYDMAAVKQPNAEPMLLP